MKSILMLLVVNMEFGFTVAIVGFSIVIVALALLVFVFQKLPLLLTIKLKKLHLKNKAKDGSPLKITPDDLFTEGNVTAAISMALHMYFSEMHDEESGIVTIKSVKKSYSPWSSKIYSVNQNWPTK